MNQLKTALRLLLAVLLGAALTTVGGCVLVALQLRPERYDIDRSGFAKDTAAAGAAPQEIPVGTRPNIVLILADDLGYGDLGAYGGTVIDTPRIDALASEGATFTQAYSSAPVCSPSRAGLLTGRYPLRSGITAAMQMADDTFTRKLVHRVGIGMSQLGAVDVLGGGNLVEGLPPSEITLAESLQAAGYDTMAIGKWHLGDFTALPEFHPHNHGFRRFVGFNGSNDDFPVAFWRDQDEIDDDIGADQNRFTKLFTDEAVKFIETAQQPYFLYLAHKDPHLPFYPGEGFEGISDGGAYGDAVEELDWSTGAVLDAIARSGQADNTIVIFTSDNGPWFDGSPGTLRGRKGQSHEGGFRVPLIVRWPGVTEAGTRIDAPTMNFDLTVTCMNAGGAVVPDDRTVDGVDLRPALAGEAVAERPLFYFKDYDVEALRLGPWKLIESASHYTWPMPLDKPDSLVGPVAGARDYSPPEGGGPIPTLGTWPMLYHLGRDPGEAYDLAAREPERAEALRQQLLAWEAAFRANPRAINGGEPG